MKTICFTGHRPNRLGGYDPSNEKNLKILWKLRDTIERYIVEEEVITFITGMALGIDQWAAKIVLKLKEKYPHIQLIAAVPCKNHSNKWNEESKKEWQRIIDSCNLVYYVSDEEYTSWCMQKRNEWMVDNSDLVIAVWDGTRGGTGNCVKYAEKVGKEIYRIDPKDY